MNEYEYIANEEMKGSLILSMDKQDLHQMNEKVLRFENQLDYIRHVGVIRRCEKLYGRATRHAQKGNVKQCAQILAELWEYVNNYTMPVTIQNENGQQYELEADDLTNTMKLCHTQYAKYLINAAKRIGEQVDRTDINELKMKEINKRLLNMVQSNLEKAKVYAEKYRVFEDVSNELQTVWTAKKAEFPIA